MTEGKTASQAVKSENDDSAAQGVGVRESLIMQLVHEGERAGKVPWCADGQSEIAAWNILNARKPYRQETMEETCQRRESELTHSGRTQTLVAWADEIGMPSKILTDRLKAGWSIDRVLTTPVWRFQTVRFRSEEKGAKIKP